MSVTRFAPGAATAYVTDAVLAVSSAGGVDAEVMAWCAAAGDGAALAAAAAERDLTAVVLHQFDRLHIAVSGSAVVTVDADDGEHRFEGSATWSTAVVDRPAAVTIRHEPSAPTDVTLCYCVDSGAVPVSVVARRFGAPSSPSTDPFDALFGQTVTRSVEAAAVRPIERIGRGDPAPGVLIFTSGERVVVDRPIVIGRNPGSNDELRGDSDAPGPRLVKVPHAGVSRRHVAIHVDRWNVSIDDLGSVNGTIVTMPGGPAVPLRPGEPLDLAPGAAVDLGGAVSFTMEEAA